MTSDKIGELTHVLVSAVYWMRCVKTEHPVVKNKSDRSIKKRGVALFVGGEKVETLQGRR